MCFAGGDEHENTDKKMPFTEKQMRLISDTNLIEFMKKCLSHGQAEKGV